MVVRTCELVDEPLLLFVLESGVPDVLNARFVNTPLAGAINVTVKLVEAFFASVSTAHVTTLLLKV